MDIPLGGSTSNKHNRIEPSYYFFNQNYFLISDNGNTEMTTCIAKTTI